MGLSKFTYNSLTALGLLMLLLAVPLTIGCAAAFLVSIFEGNYDVSSAFSYETKAKSVIIPKSPEKLQRENEIQNAVGRINRLVAAYRSLKSYSDYIDGLVKEYMDSLTLAGARSEIAGIYRRVFSEMK